ncbi:phBC6A51 family helix-turn-helix protein [Peribacillus frigoritolerans]|uniref:phBC6A51 family helix-turn-helix protein n=1 Tax=Peribacillus frigoritolerans TaxID=450367 RepID=UPI0035DA9580
MNRATLRQRALDDRFPAYKLLDKKDATTLTPLQMRCAELMATIDVHKMIMQQIADEIGVYRTIVFLWKKDPEFIAYQNSIGKGLNN